MEAKFRGKRIDNGKRVEGFHFQIKSKSYIIPETAKMDSISYWHTTTGKSEPAITGFIEVHPDSVKIEIAGKWLTIEELTELVKD